MLEVHPDPPNAAVDPLQSIDFEEFSSLVIEMNSIGKVMKRKRVGE